MAVVSEIIPDALQPEVDAALAWFNGSHPDEFEVTGIIDADLTLTKSAPRELLLVLCGGDTCQQRSFRVSDSATGFEVTYSDGDASADMPTSDGSTPLQSELDPPPGPRRSWLDTVVQQHTFVVLVFYRGFW